MTHAHLTWRGLAAAAVLITAANCARGVTINITNLLDADDFGVPATVLSGVLNRASALWQAWLPSDPTNKPAGHPQNAHFEIPVSGAAIDASGANPANTLIVPMAKPTGDLPIFIEINTDDDAVAMMFWDTTPTTTTAAEFSIALGLGAGKWKAAKGDVGFGKFDMLTVLLHELGHGLGFSRDYSEFGDWADDVWNPAHPDNLIGTPAHFSDDLNLMSNAAGFAPDGKSGRSFIQDADVAALGGAFGYMVPEPATHLLVVAAMFAVALPRMQRLNRITPRHRHAAAERGARQP